MRTWKTGASCSRVLDLGGMGGDEEREGQGEDTELGAGHVAQQSRLRAGLTSYVCMYITAAASYPHQARQLLKKASQPGVYAPLRHA
jgi:hypothetical protein